MNSPETFMFITDPLFYTCLVIGIIGLAPRVMFVAQREALPDVAQHKPTLLHHVSLMVPSLAVLTYLLTRGDIVGALVLAAVFVLAFAMGIVAMRQRRRARK